MSEFTEAFLHQITEGCGCSQCTCPFCASSPAFKIIILKPEEIATALEKGKVKICPSICPVLFDKKYQKANADLSLVVMSNNSSLDLNQIKQYIDTKDKFCSLFWGSGKYSKRDYNFDQKIFSKFYKRLQQIKVDNSKVNDNQKFDEIVSILNQRIDEIYSTGYSYFNLRGTLVFLAFAPLLSQEQYINTFSKLNKYYTEGSSNLIHDIYYVISKYPKIINISVEYSQSILTNLCLDYDVEKEPIIKSVVKHISYLSQANDISNEPIPYTKFQNEIFTQLLNPQHEVLKMIKGEFSYISKSSLLTLPFKKAVNEVESQILQFLNADETDSEFRITIKRDHILEDTIYQLHKAGEKEILRTLEVEFYREDATDQGGVSKEFISLASKLLFDQKHFDKMEHFYFFKENYSFLDPSAECEKFLIGSDKKRHNSNKDDDDENDNKNNNRHGHNKHNKISDLNDEEYYKVCGRFAGIAVHNSIILPIRFPLLFYKMLRKLVIKLDDLEEIKPEVINSLKCLLDMRNTCSDQDFNDLDLYFTISVYDEKTKDVKTLPLIINGDKIKVNRVNVQFYVQEMKKCILRSYQKAFKAFKKGFWEAVGSKTCRQFFSEELDILVSGNHIYDWNEFQKSTKYSSGYSENSETIQMFWNVFKNDFTEEQRKQFLFFLTGSINIPVDGLSGLGFEIHRSSDTSLLPVAHTCFNLLQLPDYQNANELKKNLMICIDNNEGFGVL